MQLPAPCVPCLFLRIESKCTSNGIGNKCGPCASRRAAAIPCTFSASPAERAQAVDTCFSLGMTSVNGKSPAYFYFILFYSWLKCFCTLAIQKAFSAMQHHIETVIAQSRLAEASYTRAEYYRAEIYATLARLFESDSPYSISTTHFSLRGQEFDLLVEAVKSYRADNLLPTDVPDNEDLLANMLMTKRPEIPEFAPRNSSQRVARMSPTPSSSVEAGPSRTIRATFDVERGD